MAVFVGISPSAKQQPPTVAKLPPADKMIQIYPFRVPNRESSSSVDENLSLFRLQATTMFDIVSDVDYATAVVSYGRPHSTTLLEAQYVRELSCKRSRPKNQTDRSQTFESRSTRPTDRTHAGLYKVMPRCKNAFWIRNLFLSFFACCFPCASFTIDRINPLT